ncbi:unnamed protein product [Rotaria sp. Silwood2]|nr:unnamed protein product [Rotaria sp. Silwood2]CAF3057665.1 unnamed protein product [Rotaria sp. Silwood2]CAF3301652.1 unnamed protein product [Rotaria sp. Silwood2]CAF3381374.1 unnamed protein product [Rotaria sp. Silwood2]CAF4277772.1 unnamed protein product [Rotaria sp. Silwood2]
MNNVELISHATTALKNPSFHPKIAVLINQIKCSKKRAVPTCIRPDVDIRLSQTTCVKFLHVTTYLENTYGKNQYTHHTLCFYKEVPFKVHHSSNNQVDDSALIYSDESNNLHLGLIVGIIQLKATSEIKFIIDTVQVTGYDSFSLNGTEYKNNLFIYTMMPTPPHTVSINYTSIREKVAYRKDANMNSLCEFYIFPNLLEST